MPFANPNYPLSLCTFSLLGEDALGDPAYEPPIDLGTDDAFIKITPERGYNTISVNCFYAKRDNVDGPPTPLYIDGAARAAAEVYLRDLVASLGGIVRFTDLTVDGISFTIPEGLKAPGKLENPFTDLEEENLFLVRVTNEDDGHRAYGFELEFRQPHYPDPATPNEYEVYLTFTPDGVLTPVEIGNYPAERTTTYDMHFIQHSFRTYYRQLPGEPDVQAYLQTLITDLKMEPIVNVPILRGATNNRGVIKSYQLPDGGDIEHAKAELGVAPSLSPIAGKAWVSEAGGVEVSPGLMEIKVVFIQPRND